MKEEEKEDGEQAISYHGQVLEKENDDDVDSNWMKTKFKCRKHMDHDAKLGGDGRSAMDDYEVVDQKPKDRHERKRHKKQHHKHHR